MPKYTVKSPLLHDGESFGAADIVEMPEEQAEPLLRIGIVEPATDEAASGKKGKK